MAIVGLAVKMLGVAIPTYKKNFIFFSPFFQLDLHRRTIFLSLNTGIILTSLQSVSQKKEEETKGFAVKYISPTSSVRISLLLVTRRKLCSLRGRADLHTFVI